MNARFESKSLIVGLSLVAISLFSARMLLAAPAQLSRQVQSFRASLQAPYKAPTPSLTTVANSMALRVKSLSTTVSVPANLSLERPVEISVSYYSPKRGGGLITQMYSPAGNTFNWSDNEVDGQTRHVTIYVSLYERYPDGKFSYFNFNWGAYLSPLYAVRVSPLEFRLLDDCDRWGKSDIDLFMLNPDKSRVVQSFKMRKGGYRLFNEFLWARSEIGPTDGASLPYVEFGDSDLFTKINSGYVPPPQPALVPGKSRKVQLTIKALGGGNCRAQITYTMDYALRQFQNR